MSQQIIQNSESGLLVRTKINNNFSDLYASRLSVSGGTISGDISVEGNISAAQIIYASGGNSDQWNSVYSNVNSASDNRSTNSSSVMIYWFMVHRPYEVLL